MQRETIEMSYFATCGFCSEIILAELTPNSLRGKSGSADRHARPTNDNLFRVLTSNTPATKRARRVKPAA